MAYSRQASCHRWRHPAGWKKTCGTLALCIVLGLSSCAGQGESHDTDILAGTAWISRDDGSQWVFHEDQSFHWYQAKDETEDNYFAGTYECHIGRDAIEYLTEDLAHYGVTEAEIEGVIEGGEAYTVENFVCFTTVNQSFLLNGEEQLSEEVPTSYFGFLIQDGTYLGIANMVTGTYYGFIKE